MMSLLSSFNITRCVFLMLVYLLFLLREFCSYFFLSFFDGKYFWLTYKKYFWLSRYSYCLYVKYVLWSGCHKWLICFVCFILDDCLALVMVRFCDLCYIKIMKKREIEFSVHGLHRINRLEEETKKEYATNQFRKV